MNLSPFIPLYVHSPMKKGTKITLIVVPLVLILLGGTFVGTLLYSKNNIVYEVGDPTVTGYISQIVIAFPPSINYTGYILVDTHLEINNGGLYDINELVISVDVYGQNFNSLSMLNEKLLGHGTNLIGDIEHGTNWVGDLQLNMTVSIALLAIWDGELRIEVDVSLKVDFLLYKAPLTFEESQVEPWIAPF